MTDPQRDATAPEPLPAAERALLAAYRQERGMPPEVRARLMERGEAAAASSRRRPLVLGLAVVGALAAAVVLAIAVAPSGPWASQTLDDPGSQAPMQRRGEAARPTVPRSAKPPAAGGGRTAPAPSDETSPPAEALLEAPATVATPTEEAAAPVTPAPAWARPPAARRRARPSTEPAEPAPAVEPAPEGPSAIAQERQLLTQAWSALSSGKHAQALEHAQAHARRFPEGMLAVERDAIATIAGCHARRSGWSTKARAFLASHGKTPSARRVRQACVEAPAADEER